MPNRMTERMTKEYKRIAVGARRPEELIPCEGKSGVKQGGERKLDVF